MTDQLEWMTDPCGPIIGLLIKEATMAKEETFTWLTDTTNTRSYGAKAPSLIEKGKTYPTADFPKDVVDEWVKTGNAKYGKAVKEETNG